ncbi:MAG: hypothetical protein AMXMBFR44_0370 [Candidatus Campbellbacteria bacterium]
MNRHQVTQRIEAELDTLNWVIDEKIINGISYRREAKRHKELLRWARKLRRPSLFRRLSTALALF